MKRFFFFITLFASTFVYMGSSFKPGHALDEERRKKISQNILDNLINEKYEDVRKDFAVGLKQGLPTEKIAEVWRQIIGTAGKFKKVLSVSTATDKGYNLIRMRLEFENDNLTQETAFSEEDKVISLWLKP